MPTYPASADLAEGSGTRSFSAVSTDPGDWLVVECIGQDGNITAFTPTCAGLTFGKQTDNAAGTSDVAIEQWTAPDAGGGSRTVQVAVTGTGSYRAKVTVTRNSSGPGTGKATSLTAQTVSVTRQGTDSGMFYAAGDWNAGAVGSPVWTPGGSTQASEQTANATYIFGRWDAAGAPGTASHGISSPSYTTPSIAVLEMLDAPTGGSSPIPSLPPYLLYVLVARNQAMWQTSPDTADVTVADGPAGVTAAESPATVGVDVLVADAPSAVRLAESAADAGPGTAVADTPAGMRAADSPVAVTVTVLIADTANGVRAAASPAATTIAVLVADTPSGVRLSDSPGAAGSSTFASDLASGVRAGVSPSAVTFDAVVTDIPAGARLGDSAAVAVSATFAADTPAGIRSGTSPAVVTASADSTLPDTPSGLRVGSSPALVRIRHVTFRPNTGTTSRPSSGTTARPYTGTTPRP